MALSRWSPRSPLALAGVDLSAGAAAAEVLFATTWERVAERQRGRVWRVLAPHARGVARRRDVQELLRTANTLLAERAAQCSRRDRARRRREGSQDRGR